MMASWNQNRPSRIPSNFDASLLSLQGSKQSSYKDVEEKLKTLRQRLSIDNANILHCMEDLGLLCAYEEKLRNALESSEKKCTQTELEMKDKEEKSNAMISELRSKNSSLQEKLTKEESKKFDAIDCHTKR